MKDKSAAKIEVEILVNRLLDNIRIKVPELEEMIWRIYCVKINLA
jgi:hypothetical protein